MEIDNKNIDREEERRLERKQQENRLQQEKRMQREGMKTFEAKLSEKTAAEFSQKESAKNTWYDSKKSKEEKQGLLEKIISVAKEKVTEESKQRVQTITKQKEKRRDETREEDKRLADLFKREKSRFKGDEGKEKADTSPEGHRRVAEKKEGEGGGFGAFGDNFQGGQGMGQDLGSSLGSSQGQKKSFAKEFGIGKVKPVTHIGAATKGFDTKARGFRQENIEEIVARVSLGLNSVGEEELLVELSDVYFNGLKIACARSEEGVVLKFICPNVAVRSTFLKERPKLYLHFKQKGLKIFRIDVI